MKKTIVELPLEDMTAETIKSWVKQAERFKQDRITFKFSSGSKVKFTISLK